MLKESFLKYLETGSRSNEKLKILHGYINQIMSSILSNDFIIHSINTAEPSKEKSISSIYMDKKVDITITKRNQDQEITKCGIAIKFVMSNYSQNSNNYFEYIATNLNIDPEFGKNIFYYYL